MYYLSCPDCKKKVTDEAIGYRCENCDKVHQKVQVAYMLNAKVSDPSGSIFVSFPRELGEPIMNGLTAEKFKEMKD